MNTKFPFLIGLLCFICLAEVVRAQPPVVRSEIDSTHLLIGHQTRIRLEVAAGKDQQVQLPMVTDTLTRGVEVLEISKVDTLNIGNDRVQYKYDYLITSFDSALYLLPPFRVIAGNDTAYSQELALKVSTLQVDVENPDQYYDIKDVRKPEFVWKDYLSILLYILLGAIVVAAIVYLVYRLKNRKSLVPFLKKDEPDLPAHEKAIRQLDGIKAKKLWQQGKIKEYHSEISDTLRRYIDERFRVGAMEMTSGEILSALKRISDADIAYDNLKQILQLADFVKFAKYSSLPDENELSMMNAYLFVNNTKIAEPPKENDENNENEKNDNTDSNSKK